MACVRVGSFVLRDVHAGRHSVAYWSVEFIRAQAPWARGVDGRHGGTIEVMPLHGEVGHTCREMCAPAGDRDVAAELPRRTATFILTKVGRALVEDSRRARGLPAPPERVERSPAADPWARGLDPRPAADGEAEVVTESEYAEALSHPGA